MPLTHTLVSGRQWLFWTRSAATRVHSPVLLDRRAPAPSNVEDLD
ncbi:hypothetical protein [Brachybacterium muris]|nr:hypothetical protein [Brachybacterium muris]